MLDCLLTGNLAVSCFENKDLACSQEPILSLYPLTAAVAAHSISELFGRNGIDPPAPPTLHVKASAPFPVSS